MIKKGFYHIFLFCLLLVLSVQGKTTATAKTVISDNAHLLTAEQAESVRSSCDSIFTRYDISVYLVTSSHIGKSDDYKSYLKQISESEDSPENLVLLFISTKEKSPLCELSTYGTAKTQLNQKRCDKLKTAVKKNIKQKHYYEALTAFCDELPAYLNKSTAFDFFLFHPLVQLFLCLLASIFIVCYILHNPEEPLLSAKLFTGGFRTAKESLKRTIPKKK